MRYRTLGSTGILVSPYCLGAMMFGGWANADQDDGVRIIHKALDAGINFVATADVYSRGDSEEIVGKALKGRRDSVVLATTTYPAYVLCGKLWGGPPRGQSVFDALASTDANTQKTSGNRGFF